VGGLVLGWGSWWRILSRDALRGHGHGRIDGLFCLFGVAAGMLGFAAAYPGVQRLYLAGSMGVQTLPQALHLPHGWSCSPSCSWLWALRGGGLGRAPLRQPGLRPCGHGWPPSPSTRSWPRARSCSASLPCRGRERAPRRARGRARAGSRRAGAEVAPRTLQSGSWPGAATTASSTCATRRRSPPTGSPGRRTRPWRACPRPPWPATRRSWPTATTPARPPWPGCCCAAAATGGARAAGRPRGLEARRALPRAPRRLRGHRHAARRGGRGPGPPLRRPGPRRRLVTGRGSPAHPGAAEGRPPTPACRRGRSQEREEGRLLTARACSARLASGHLGLGHVGRVRPGRVLRDRVRTQAGGLAGRQP